MRKTKNYLKKTLNDLEKLHPDFPERGKEERSAGHVGIFCQNLGITAHTLENYSNFKAIFHLTMRVFFEIHDDFRSRGNASFNSLSQIIKENNNKKNLI